MQFKPEMPLASIPVAHSWQMTFSIVMPEKENGGAFHLQRIICYFRIRIRAGTESIHRNGTDGKYKTHYIMTKRTIRKNYDVFSIFNYHVPDVKGMFILLAWMLVGALLGNLASMLVLALFAGTPDAMGYATLVSYPIMFIPPMIYAGYMSSRDSLFDIGFVLDNDHVKPLGWPFCIILVMLGTLAASFISELCGFILPPMPEWLESTLGNMTEGNIWINLICVSIFAPFFEEWLCRGEVLRGLLNFKRKDKDGNETRGMKPANAIIISAAFFALIHLNPWQAIPAFLLGCLFGYVYYRTGSLKLTMLMHCTNNTFAVVISHIDRFKDADTMKDLMSMPMYVALMLFSIAFLVYLVFKFKSIELQDPQGNCDRISA